MSKKPLSSLLLMADKDTAERTNSEAVIRNNVWLMTRLREVFLGEIAKIERAELSLNAYDTPAWSHRQAHLNGMRQAYNEILKLTDFLE